MADEGKIGIESDLQQPIEDMHKLEAAIARTSTVAGGLQAQLKALIDAKFGNVTTANFDKAVKEILRMIRQSNDLLKNENVGGTMARTIATQMAKGFQENATGYARTLTDGILKGVMDAEKVVKNMEFLKIFKSNNAGIGQFIKEAVSTADAGRTLTTEKQLELVNRLKAAEALMYAARLNFEKDGSTANQALVAQRRLELQLLQATKLAIDQATQAREREARAQEAVNAATERRALKIEQRSYRPAARLTTQEVINQTLGIDRTPSEEEQAARLRAYYRKQQETAERIRLEESDRAVAQRALREARVNSRRLQLQGAPAQDQAIAQQAVRDAEQRYEQMVARSQQDIQRLRLFGDGGGFLAEIQARLLLNYRILNSFVQTFQFGVKSVVDFDEALHQLQAIANLTTPEIGKLKEVITDISATSRYSMTQVAEAATLLAQAGFGARQIGEALKPITQLAQATGSSLKTAVEVTTSVLGAFNYRANETTNIVNIMTSALNTSKLDMEKLALGVQYSANIAAQSGVSFSELAAVISALSNTGVRSGSTLGTGISQIFNDLLNPTDKMKKALAQVGLTLADVDIKSRGFIPVIQKMAEAGFSTAQAFEGFEVRAARAFLGLVGQAGQLNQLQADINNGARAADTSAIAMNSLKAVSDQVAASFGALSVSLAGGATPSILNVLKGVRDLIQGIAGMDKTLLGFIGTIGTGAALILLTALFTRIGASVIAATGSVLTFNGALSASTLQTIAFGTAATGAASAATRLNLALGILQRIALPLFILTFFVTLATGLFDAKTAGEQFAETMDKVRAKSNEANQEVSKQAETQQSVNKTISDLIAKYDTLDRDSGALAAATADLKTRFADLGIELPKTVTRVEELIIALNKLKKFSQDSELLALGAKITAAESEATAFSERIASFRKGGAAASAIGALREDADKSQFATHFRNIYTGSDATKKVKDIGGVEQIPALLDAIQSGNNEQVEKTLTALRLALLEQRRKLASEKDQPYVAGQIATETNVAIAEFMVQRAEDYLKAVFGKEKAERTITSALDQQNRIRVAQSEVSKSMGDMLIQGQIAVQKLIDESKNAPIADRVVVAKQAIDQAKLNYAGILEFFEASLLNKSEADKKVAMEEFNKTVGSDLRASIGQAQTQYEAVLTETNKREQELLNLKIATTKRELDALERRLKVTSTDDSANLTVIAEIAKKAEELAQLNNELSKKKLELMVGEANAVERSRMEIEADSKLLADQWANREKTNNELRNEQRKLFDEENRKGRDEVQLLRARLSTLQGELSGALGKGLTGAQRDAMVKEVQNIVAGIVLIELRALRREMELAGKSLEPDENPALKERAEAITKAGEETIKKFGDKMYNSAASAGQEELSRELREMLGNMEVLLKQLAQKFKEINKGLENAERAADLVQDQFNINQAADQSPQNRARIPSTLTEVKSFNDAFKVADEVRRLKAIAIERALTEQTDSRAKTQQLIDDLVKKEQELSKGAPGNNAATAALVAVREKLQSARGQLESFNQSIEKNEISLQKLNMEIRGLNQIKSSPSAFEVLEAGAQAWLIKSKAFQDSTAALGERIPAMVDVLSGSMATFFDEISFGTKSAGDAFRDMAKNIIKSLISILNQMLAMQILKHVFGFLGIAIGGAGPADGLGVKPGAGLASSFEKSTGGLIGHRRFAGGGHNRDSIIGSFMPGEYVMRRSAVQNVGVDTLDRINQMGNNNQPPNLTGENGPFNGDNQQQGGGTVNVWVVPEGRQPPPPSAKDIIAIVNSDIVKRGSTHKLIKQVQMGQN